MHRRFVPQDSNSVPKEQSKFVNLTGLAGFNKPVQLASVPVLPLANPTITPTLLLANLFAASIAV